MGTLTGSNEIGFVGKSKDASELKESNIPQESLKNIKLIVVSTRNVYDVHGCRWKSL